MQSVLVECGVAAALVSFLVACGNQAAPPTSAAAAPEAEMGRTAPPHEASSSASTAAVSTGATSEAPPASRRKPFTIHSSCGEVVTVAFGEDPKSESSGKRTLSPSSFMEGPRDAEGKQTVWLLGAKDEPLVKVHVTRGMTQVEIGRSCRTLDAR